MVRRHSQWARSRMKRSRPKTPAPKEGWLMAELSRISGMTVRRLRDYVARDLIAPIERRGTATRYARSQLVRLMAIKRMRAELELELAEIKRRMDAMGERELEAWIAQGPLPEAARTALGIPPLNVVQPGGVGIATDSPFAPRTGTTASPAEATSAGEAAPFAAWYHLELLPGLVLQLRSTASPAVRSAAKRIYDEYAGS